MTVTTSVSQSKSRMVKRRRIGYQRSILASGMIVPFGERNV